MKCEANMAKEFQSIARSVNYFLVCSYITIIKCSYVYKLKFVIELICILIATYMAHAQTHNIIKVNTK